MTVYGPHQQRRFEHLQGHAKPGTEQAPTRKNSILIWVKPLLFGAVDHSHNVDSSNF